MRKHSISTHAEAEVFWGAQMCNKPQSLGSCTISSYFTDAIWCFNMHSSAAASKLHSNQLKMERSQPMPGNNSSSHSQTVYFKDHLSILHQKSKLRNVWGQEKRVSTL
jgi:hypothetical protein